MIDITKLNLFQWSSSVISNRLFVYDLLQSIMMNALIEACVDELNKQDVHIVHPNRSVMDGLLR